MMPTLECDVLDLLINPPSSPGWLCFQLEEALMRLHFCHLGVNSVRGESSQYRVCGPVLCSLFASPVDGMNEDQEETVGSIFFVGIHDRKTILYVFHGIINEHYYSVFSIFQCHSNVFVDLNANFINKKSLMGVFVVFYISWFETNFVLYFNPTLVMWSSDLRAQQKPRLYPLVSGWNANNVAERLFD